jgi:hypothetical protein
MSCVSLLLVRAQFRGITTPISSLIKNSPRIWASHESSRFLSLTACLDKREGTRKQRVTPETSYLLPTVVRPPHTDEILRDLRHFSTAQSLLDKSQELKPEDVILAAQHLNISIFLCTYNFDFTLLVFFSILDRRRD